MKPVTGIFDRASAWKEKVPSKGGKPPLGGIGVCIEDDQEPTGEKWYNSTLMTEDKADGYFTGYEGGDEIIILLKANGEYINFTDVYKAEIPPLPEGEKGHAEKEPGEEVPRKPNYPPRFLDISRELTEEELQLFHDNAYEIAIRCVKAARDALWGGAKAEYETTIGTDPSKVLHEIRKMADTILINALGGKRR